MAGVFSKAHVYLISASQTGDGCGFTYDSPAAQQAREALADFLERALSVVPEVEVFVRYIDPWTGAATPSSFDRIGPEDIRTWRRFVPDEFLVVSDTM